MKYCRHRAEDLLFAFHLYASTYLYGDLYSPSRTDALTDAALPHGRCTDMHTPNRTHASGCTDCDGTILTHKTGKQLTDQQPSLRPLRIGMRKQKSINREKAHP